MRLDDVKADRCGHSQTGAEEDYPQVLCYEELLASYVGYAYLNQEHPELMLGNEAFGSMYSKGCIPIPISSTLTSMARWLRQFAAGRRAHAVPGLQSSRAVASTASRVGRVANQGRWPQMRLKPTHSSEFEQLTLHLRIGNASKASDPVRKALRGNSSG